MKKKIIIAAIVILVLGGIGTALNSEEGASVEQSSAEKILNNNKDIIWKEDENIGILNIELDGTKTKQGIIAEYYTELSEYMEELDKESIGDYEYVECVGNVMKNGKIECTIKGNLTIEFIKTSDDLSPAYIESNMQDLFIPKPLR